MHHEPGILVCDHRGAGLAERLALLALPTHHVHTTANLRASLRALRDGTPSVIVLDPCAPGGAVELGEIDRVRCAAPVVPLLFVADPEHALPHALITGELGDEAWDVVRRDASLDEYRLRIARLEEAAARIDELDELRYVALHDERTDLLRPKAFQERLREHFSAAQRHGLDLVLLLLDLDDFGRVNKLFDHTVGDLVIARVGEVIRRALRAEDVAGRLGGDEFAVLLPYTKRLDGARVANRLRAEIAELTDEFRARGLPARISCSLGFETFSGKDVDSVEELRRHTEIALQKAKVSGGNRGIYFRSLP